MMQLLLDCVYQSDAHKSMYTIINEMTFQLK